MITILAKFHLDWSNELYCPSIFVTRIDLLCYSCEFHLPRAARSDTTLLRTALEELAKIQCSASVLEACSGLKFQALGTSGPSPALSPTGPLDLVDIVLPNIISSKDK